MPLRLTQDALRAHAHTFVCGDAIAQLTKSEAPTAGGGVEAGARNDVKLHVDNPCNGVQECAIELLDLCGRALGVAPHEEGLTELVQPVRDFRHRLDQGARVELGLLIPGEICVWGMRARRKVSTMPMLLIDSIERDGMTREMRS